MTEPDGPVVRPAEPGDFTAIQAIYAAEVLHGTASFETRPPSVAEMRARWRRLAGDGYPWLVCVANEILAGYACAGPYRARPGYRFTVENSVYVAVTTRGCGIGRRLLADLIDACDAAGYRQMVAVIGDSAHVASIRLHQSLGFRRAGTLCEVGYKFDRWLDTVIMQRALGIAAKAFQDRSTALPRFNCS